MPTSRTLSAGELRERIQFQRPVRTNDRGFASIVWTNAFSVWASTPVLNGVNDLTQDRRGAKLQIDFDTRYRDDITSDMRALWNGQTFEVTDLLPNAAFGRLHVRCVEETSP